MNISQERWWNDFWTFSFLSFFFFWLANQGKLLGERDDLAVHIFSWCSGKAGFVVWTTRGSRDSITVEPPSSQSRWGGLSLVSLMQPLSMSPPWISLECLPLITFFNAQGASVWQKAPSLLFVLCLMLNLLIIWINSILKIQTLLYN